MVRMVRAFTEGRLARGAGGAHAILPALSDLFIESNPIPIKTALNLAGRISADVRLPLCEMAPGNLAKLLGDTTHSQPRQVVPAMSDTAPLRLLVNGAKGRMGQAIIACAKLDPGVEVTAQVDAGDDFVAALAGADGVIEFSHHAVTPGVARACAAAGKLLVIGTTGHTDES